MRLVNFGPGEMCDRLSILALKILFGKAANKEVDHFEKEQAILLTKIASRTLSATWCQSMLDLAAVNSAIWHAEDDLRELAARQGPTEWAGKLAFRLQELNDRRARLIETINKEAGDHLGSEKL